MCKCIKKKTVKEQACQCHKKNKHYSYCTDGVVFNVKESYFSTKGINHCLMHAIYRSKSISCKKDKRTTPLNRKCNIKRNYSYFKHYLITWNKRVGCKCIKQSKKITKLCKCSKNVKKIKCIADDTLKIYQMTITKVGKHCLPKQEITTRDIQCNGKERDIRYSNCIKHGKHKCFQKVKVTERWVENCKCKVKSINLLRRCCVPKSIKVKFCDKKLGEHVQKTSIFKLTLGKLLYRKDDFMIQDKKLIKSIIFQKQKIFCPSRSVDEKCDKKSGKWIKRITSYKRVGCKCKRFIKKINGKCRCPESRKITSKCKNEFQTIRTVMYQLIDRYCVKFSQVAKQRCGCPRQVRRIYCDGEGRWVKCVTEFNFNREFHTCSLEKRCVRWDQVCPDPYRVNGKCDKRTHKRRNSDISFNLNEEKCSCEKSMEHSTEFCTCQHLNRKVVKCFDGVHVTMKTLHSLKKGQCLSTRVKIKKKIHCPRTIKRVMKCDRNKHSKKRGYRLIKLTTFHNRNCKCIKKTSTYHVPCDCKILHRPVKRKFCKIHKIKMSQVFYRVLIGKKCVKRTKFFKKNIVCSDHKKKKASKCQKSRKSKIFYKSFKIYHQVPKNCKCIWKLKKKFTKICKCPPKTITVKCVRHNTIKKVVTVYVKSGKKCKKHRLIDSNQVHCSKRWKSTKCKKSTCTLYINHYSQKSSNCKCVLRKKTTKAKCCCPKPTKKHTICVDKKHTFKTSWFTFKLMDKSCVRKKRFSSFKVRCERREPKVKMGKCVKHHRTVYIITKRNHKCKCINVIKRLKERCKCPRRIKFIKGKCIGKFAKDRWSALKFLKETKKCVRAIIQSRTRRCKCPPSKKTSKCINSDTIIRTKTKYLLQKNTNSCKRYLSKFKHHIGCTKKPLLIGMITSKCIKHNGYYKIQNKTYKIAKKCKCVTFSRTTSWPCNCKKLYPSSKVVKCLKHKYLVTKIRSFYGKLKKCVPKIIKKTTTIKCFGHKKKIGKCNRKTKKRIVLLYRKKIANCHCKWALIKRIFVLCMCPKSTTKVKCVKGKFFRKTKLTFHLRKHKCILQRSQISYGVKCDSGVKIKISKCDSFSGYKTITKTMKTINKCQCFTQRSKKKCRCHCPKPMKYTSCIRHTGYFKTTKVIHKLDKCKCISKRKVSMSKIKCPKSKVLITMCKVYSKHHLDKYKSIIKISHQRDGCKCVKVIKKKKVLCSCSPSIQKHRKCVKHKYKLMTVTKRIKNHGGCKRVEIDNDKLEIDCPDNKTRKHCNKKTGLETIMILRWNQKDCKCFSHKTVKKRKCKCKSQHKLVHSLKCNKKCYKVKVFKFEILKNYKCITKYVARRKKCCCPKLVKTESKCLQNVGMIQSTKRFLRLIDGKCVTEYSKKKRIIRCPKKKSKKVIKLPKGLIKIIISNTKRIGCHCKTVKKTLYRSWKCPKSRKTTKCVDAPESSKETVSITYKMMTKTTGCKKLVVVHREPTECEADRTYWTKCKLGKNGYYKTLVQISYSAKNCKCHKSIEKTQTLCKCDKPKIKRFCEKSKGLQVQIVTHFVPDSRTNKHCLPIVTRQQFKVLCEKHFKFSHKTKCSKKTSMFKIVSKAEKQIGCSCKKILRSKHCRCKCPNTKIHQKCRHDNVKEKIITKWILLKCACKKLISSHLESIKCPEQTKSYHKCGGPKGKCIRQIIITTYKSQNCKCKKINKILLRKCCCPKSSRFKKCQKGHWVTKYVSYKLTKGRCFRTSSQKSQRIVCTSESIIQMIGPCVGKRQKYLLTKFVRNGCKCVKIFKKFYRHCLCLNKSAAEVIFLVDQAVSSRQPEYQTIIRKLLKETVNVFPIGKRSYRFALVKYSENPSVVFNLNDHHKHSSLMAYINKLPYSGRSSNLARALHLTRTKILRHSRPGILQLIYIISDGNNDGNMKNAFKEIRKFKKIHVRVNAVAIKSSHKGLKFLKGLLAGPHSHLWRIHKRKQLKSLPQKILRTICKKACPIANIKRSKCSKETGCVGKTFIYGYKFVGKQCIRKITTKNWLCCCPKKSKHFKICLKNRKLLVKIDWKFKNKSCVKHISKKDISGDLFETCRPKVQHRTGHCTSSKYRSITTITRSVKHCKCIKSIKKHYQLCRCSKSKRIKMCEKTKYIKHIKLYETLTKNKCIKRRNVSRIPIVCSKPKIHMSKCNRITCLKKIRVIKFFPKNCQCHHKTKTRHIKCCCPLNKHTERFCKSNRKIYRKTFTIFNKKLKTCVKKSIRKTQMTKCNSKPTIRSGKCNIPMGKVWFRLKEIKWSIAKNCKCIKMIKHSKIPCRCSKGPILKKCTKNGVWKKYEIRYKLITFRKRKQIMGKCKKEIKILDMKKHKCQKHFQRQSSKCRKDKTSNYKYRSVIISWVVQRNCKCVKLFKRIKELCKCPKGLTKTKCIKDKYLVTFHTWFKFSGGKGKSKCSLKSKKFSKTINCPKPTVVQIKCKSKHQKFQIIRTTLYISRKCKCSRKTYVRKLKCQNHFIGVLHAKPCGDILPIKICKKMKLIGGCKKQGVYRNKLCRMTCNQCSKCPVNSKIGFKINYNSCLVTDRRYNFKLHLSSHKMISYHKCMMKCKTIPSCKSFDFYITKKKGPGSCVLSKISPTLLETKIYPHQMKLGATYKDLRRHKARNCILSVKICKNVCPSPMIKKLGKCKCAKIKNRSHCHRKSNIFYFIASRSGRCLKRSWKGLIPCHVDGCNNWKSDKQCHKLKLKGKCPNKIVKKICKKTCSKCKCSKSYSYETNCNKSNYRFKIQISMFKHSKHGKCVMIIKKRKKSCNVCYKKPFRIIHKCENSVRYVSTIQSVKLKNGKCKIISSNKAFSCSKCPKQDQHFVTSCGKSGFLKLITKYSVREKGCCRFKIDSRKLWCKKCPQRKVRKTHCSEGYRLRHVYYYVRDSKNEHKGEKSKCRRKVYTRKEKCLSHRVCEDRLSKMDCNLFKKYNGCHKKEADAYKLCRATCGLC